MADPLGSITGILGACDVLLHTFQAAAQYVSDVKAAPKDFKRIQFEVQNLQAITAALGEFLKSEKVKTHGFPDSAPIAKAIEECKAYISKLQDDFTAKYQKSRLLWPLSGKKEVQQTLQDLDRFTNLFHWALSVNGWSFFCDSMEKTTKTLQDSLESYENMVRLLKPFPEMRPDIKDIKDHCKVIRSVLQVFNDETVPKCSSDIAKILTNVEDIKLEMQNKADDKGQKELLDWMSTENFLHKQRDVSGARQGGTSTWIFEDPRFAQWTMSGDVGTLWCHGIPGSGKTIVFGAIVDWLLDTQRQMNTIVAVVYFDYKEHSTYNNESIFLGILRQCCVQSYHLPQVKKALKDLKSRCMKERDRRPKLKDFEELLDIFRETHETIFVCCDGLDELPDSSRLALMRSLVDLYQRYNIKILLTSRDHVELTPCPGNLVKCPISATLPDLRTYLESRIDAAQASCLSMKADKSSSLRVDIIAIISAKSKGMFLLAELHIKQLESAITEREIKDLLRVLPEAIDDHYKSYIERIESHRQGARAMDAILWIYSSYRPLSPEELLEVLSIQDGDTNLDASGMMTIDTVLNITGGLLALEKENNTIRLVHETLQEFLNQRAKLVFPDGHLKIARTLATYLRFKSFDTPAEVLSSHWITLSALQRSHKLLKYAFLYWADHIRDAGPLCSSIGLETATRIASSSVLLRFISQTGLFRIPLLDPAGFLSLHIATLWKSKMVIKESLAHLSDWDRSVSIGHRSRTGLTPLHLAAMNNDLDILKLLSGFGATLQDADVNGRTAIYFATACSNLDALRFLVAMTSLPDPINLPLNNAPAKIMVTPLHLAVQRGEKTRLINFADEIMVTPLHLALQNGDENCVRELLLAGADVEARTATGQTPLHYAVKYTPRLTDLLLEHGASIETRSENGRNALHFACTRGDLHTITVLLDKGCNPNLKSVSGDCALHLLAQAEIEQLNCVGPLIQHGALLNETDNKGWTPLHHAVSTKHFEIAKSLIRLGADVYIRSKDDLLALQLAAAHDESPSDLWALLGFVNSRGIGGDTPLHVAARTQKATEVENLIKFHADLNLRNKNGETALHAAVQNYSNYRRSTHIHSRSDVVSLLLDNGADVNLQSETGVTPIDLAVKTQMVALLMMFRPHIATVHSRLPDGTSYLEFALLNGNLPSINILLGHDADGKDPCLSTLQLRNAIRILLEHSRVLVQQGELSLDAEESQVGATTQNGEPNWDGKQPFRICKLNCTNVKRCRHIINVCEKAFLLARHAVPSRHDSNWNDLLDVFKMWCFHLKIPLNKEPVAESCLAAVDHIFRIIQAPESPGVKEVVALPVDGVEWNDIPPHYERETEEHYRVENLRRGSVAACFSPGGFRVDPSYWNSRNHSVPGGPSLVRPHSGTLPEGKRSKQVGRSLLRTVLSRHTNKVKPPETSC